MQALDILQLIPGLNCTQPPQHGVQVSLVEGAHVPYSQGNHFRLLINRKDALDVEGLPGAQDQLQHQRRDGLILGSLQILPHTQAHERSFVSGEGERYIRASVTDFSSCCAPAIPTSAARRHEAPIHHA
jgi:hypothetical protein